MQNVQVESQRGIDVSGTTDAIRTLIERKIGEPMDKTGDDWNYECPFCNEAGQTHRIHINYVKKESAESHGMAICHGCGFGSRNLVTLIKALYGSLPKTLGRLLYRSQFSLDLDKVVRDMRTEMYGKGVGGESVGLPEGFRPLPFRHDPVARKIEKYLRSRGMTSTDIERSGVGFVRSGRLKGYAVFPCWMNGEVVYWQGRAALDSCRTKMYNPPCTYKQSILFGFDEVQSRRRIYIVEGVFDQLSFRGRAVGLLGKNMHDSQVKLLASLSAESYILCLDADTWTDVIRVGHRQVRRIPHYARLLRDRLGVRVGVVHLGERDPGHRKCFGRIHRLVQNKIRWVNSALDESMEALKR